MNRIKKILHLIILTFIITLLSQIEGYTGRYAPTFVPTGWYLSSGLNIGKTTKDDRTIGGEVSIVSVHNYRGKFSGLFSGLFADTIYDKDLNSYRISFGPEIGYVFFCVDGGITIQYDNKKINYGYTIRPLLTVPMPCPIPLIAPYFRFTNIQGQDPIKEWGVLIKLAVKL